MFFDSVEEVVKIASKVGTSVFVVPKNVEINIKDAIILEPEVKTVITIEQVRDAMKFLNVKQKLDIYIMIRPAEALGEEASNALLKNLEEPGDNVHFVLVTDSPASLLPTILSRSAVYFLKSTTTEDAAVVGDKKMIELARKLVVARPTDLPGLAEQIVKKKDGVRAYALEVLALSIEILYKSYFKTKRDVFAKKIPKFVAAYDAISKNGHIKLHLVADLL